MPTFRGQLSLFVKVSHVCINILYSLILSLLTLNTFKTVETRTGTEGDKNTPKPGHGHSTNTDVPKYAYQYNIPKYQNKIVLGTL